MSPYRKYYYTPEQLGVRPLLPKPGQIQRGTVREHRYGNEWVLYYDYFITGSGQTITKVIGYKRSGSHFKMADGRTASLYFPIPESERKHLTRLLGVKKCEFHEGEE